MLKITFFNRNIVFINKNIVTLGEHKPKNYEIKISTF